MKNRWLLSFVLMASALILAGCNGRLQPPELEQTAAAQRKLNPVYRWDGSLVPGSRSTLVSNNAGAMITIHTSGLTARDAVTIWWVVFNYPQACTAPLLGLSQCGEADVFKPGVEASVLYATGHIIGGSGRGNFGAYLSLADTSGALFGPGLLNPRGAEIHLVVRSHGPMIPGLVHEQISTFAGGYDEAPPDGSLGAPGPNTCDDQQFVIHQQ